MIKNSTPRLIRTGNSPDCTIILRPCMSVFTTMKSASMIAEKLVRNTIVSTPANTSATVDPRVMMSIIASSSPVVRPSVSKEGVT